MCGNPNGLEVHHNTYDRLWCEDPEDLAVVCADCHGTHHGIDEPTHIESPYTFWPIIHMSDGSIRKGPNMERVGTHGTTD